jgi:acetamidase/formamidase
MREEEFLPAERAVEAGVSERGPGPHPMTGPIYVEGAEPGDVLEVVLERIELLSNWGVSGFLPGGGTIPDEFPYGAIKVFRLDRASRTATMDGTNVRIPLAPFFGTIGVAPPVLSGRISTTAPGPYTGNLDNKELVAGTRLFVPVLVTGGLLSIGDGHAAQGDGEVSGTAIETSLSGTVRVLLHKGMGRRWPWAETPTHYISMGLHTDLDEAARLATREMVELLVREKGMDPADAYVLCSVALDLRVTQLVDQTKGVHGMLAKSLFP